MANDPYWNSVVLAMHMDDTGLTDLKGHAVTLNGNVARSATQSKFGGYSAYFDGTGDYLSLADSDDWNFGAGDWTIEAWVYPTTSGVVRTIVAQRISTDATQQYTLRLLADNKLAFSATVASAVVTSVTTSVVIPANAWTHVVAVRVSGVAKLYVGGADVTVSTTNSATAYTDMSSPIVIGRAYSDIDGSNFTGYIDDLRITKGVARYTANFAIPTEAFPNTPPQLLGTVRDMNSNLVARTVRSYRRSDGMLAGTTVSSGVDGTFSVNAYDGSAHYVVCLDDGTPDENALILDNITPV